MIIQVGQPIGVWWTIAILIADSILGSMLLRSQGRAAWRRFNEALAAGPAAGARGGRRRAHHLRRRAAADARLHHRHLRPAAPAPADARARAPAARRASRPADPRRRDAAARAGPPPRPAGRTTSRAPRWTSTPTTCRGSPLSARAGAPAGRRAVHRRGHLRVRPTPRPGSTGSRASGSPGGRRAARSPCCSPAASRSRVVGARAASRSSAARLGVADPARSERDRRRAARALDACAGRRAGST